MLYYTILYYNIIYYNITYYNVTGGAAKGPSPGWGEQRRGGY